MNQNRTWSPVNEAGLSHPATASPSWDSGAGLWGILVLSLGLIFVPLFYWSGLGEAASYSNWTLPVGSRSMEWLAMVLSGSLIAAPWLWILRTGRFDVVAMALAQNGLLMIGYFFLDETIARQGGIGYDTGRYAGLLLILNAVGFATLLTVMSAVYLLSSKKKESSLRMPMDERVILLLRLVGLVCAVVLFLPMIQSRTIPLLAENATQARYDIIESSWVRPLYHFGSALLPLAVAGMAVWIFRSPRRMFGWDGIFCFLMISAQILTSNRLPLATTLIVTLALLSMEVRLPRFLVALGFLVFLGFFTFLSGFTSILREARHEIHPQTVVRDSFEKAFVGDNLIDLRDGSWVLSKWDFQPLHGKTYLGAVVAFMPSGIFPQKKEWHLGRNAVAIVGWEEREHFGLRLTFFAESFLNFGMAGVLGLGAFLGGCFGFLLRKIHEPGPRGQASLARNLVLVATMQMLLPLSNTSDAYMTWSIAALLLVMAVTIWLPAQRFGGRRIGVRGLAWRS
jgi:hypothetical protein